MLAVLHICHQSCDGSLECHRWHSSCCSSLPCLVQQAACSCACHLVLDSYRSCGLCGLTMRNGSLLHQHHFHAWQGETASWLRSCLSASCARPLNFYRLDVKSGLTCFCASRELMAILRSGPSLCSGHITSDCAANCGCNGAIRQRITSTSSVKDGKLCTWHGSQIYCWAQMFRTGYVQVPWWLAIQSRTTSTRRSCHLGLHLRASFQVGSSLPCAANLGHQR